VRDQPELVPHSEAGGGDAVGDRGAAHGQHLVAAPVLAPDLEVGLELRGIGHRHLEEDDRLVIGNPVGLALLLPFLQVLPLVTFVRLVGDDVDDTRRDRRLA
jgi:hypothetical protein